MAGVEAVLLLKDGNRIDSYFYPPKTETTFKHILKSKDPREILIPTRNQVTQTEAEDDDCRIDDSGEKIMDRCSPADSEIYF